MLEIISVLVALIGTGVAIYQWAVINESKKRRSEIQFILAGIHQLALSKQIGWNNQMCFLPPPQNAADLSIFRLHTQARDSLMEISSAITALEGVIDTKSSAITSMLEKTIKQAQLNNELQSEGLRNPTLPTNQQGSLPRTGEPNAQQDESTVPSEATPSASPDLR